MSVSSLAESSALRLAPTPTTPEAVPGLSSAVETAAAAAVDASKAGKDKEAAVAAGTEAAVAAGTEAAAAAAAAAEAPSSVGPSALTQLVSFVPTETLALYVAVDTALGEAKAPAGGLACQADFSARWWWLLGLFLATVALTIGLSYRKQVEATPAIPFMFPWVEVLAGSVAFLIWALSLPGTPLRTFCGYNPSNWGPVLLLAGTIGIATTLYVFGKTVTWTKVLKQ